MKHYQICLSPLGELSKRLYIDIVQGTKRGRADLREITLHLFSTSRPASRAHGAQAVLVEHVAATADLSCSFFHSVILHEAVRTPKACRRMGCIVLVLAGSRIYLSGQGYVPRRTTQSPTCQYLITKHPSLHG